MKIHFAYYNQYKNGIDIAFADNTLLFLSCAEAEKNLHTRAALPYLPVIFVNTIPAKIKAILSVDYLRFRI